MLVKQHAADTFALFQRNKRHLRWSPALRAARQQSLVWSGVVERGRPCNTQRTDCSAESPGGSGAICKGCFWPQMQMDVIVFGKPQYQPLGAREGHAWTENWWPLQWRHPLRTTPCFESPPRGFSLLYPNIPQAQKTPPGNFFWLRPRSAGVACSLHSTRGNPSESMFRAVQCYDDPTNDCGSGSDTV